MRSRHHPLFGCVSHESILPPFDAITRAGRGATARTREVQITNAELCTLDVDRQIHLAATAQILDVTVSTVFRPTGDCPGALSSDLGFEVSSGAPRVHVLRVRKLGNNAIERVGADQLALSPVPFGKNGGARCTA